MSLCDKQVGKWKILELKIMLASFRKSYTGFLYLPLTPTHPIPFLTNIATVIIIIIIIIIFIIIMENSYGYNLLALNPSRAHIMSLQ